MGCINLCVARINIDKALAEKKLRIVPMGAVTVEEEVLVQALLKIAKLPGNECRRVAKKVMEHLIKEGKQYGESVEESREGGSEGTEGDTPGQD